MKKLFIFVVMLLVVATTFAQGVQVKDAKPFVTNAVSFASTAQDTISNLMAVFKGSYQDSLQEYYDEAFKGQSWKLQYLLDQPLDSFKLVTLRPYSTLNAQRSHAGEVKFEWLHEEGLRALATTKGVPLLLVRCANPQITPKSFNVVSITAKRDTCCESGDTYIVINNYYGDTAVANNQRLSSPQDREEKELRSKLDSTTKANALLTKALIESQGSVLKLKSNSFTRIGEKSKGEFVAAVEFAQLPTYRFGFGGRARLGKRQRAGIALHFSYLVAPWSSDFGKAGTQFRDSIYYRGVDGFSFDLTSFYELCPEKWINPLVFAGVQGDFSVKENSGPAISPQNKFRRQTNRVNMIGVFGVGFVLGNSISVNLQANIGQINWFPETAANQNGGDWWTFTEGWYKGILTPQLSFSFGF